MSESEAEGDAVGRLQGEQKYGRGPRRGHAARGEHNDGTEGKR